MRRSSFPLNSLIVMGLCVCIAFTIVPPTAFGQKKTAPVEATPPPVREEFKFDKVDLELREQVELLDRRFDREGMVLEDPATNAYLARIGQTLIPREPVIDNVTPKALVIENVTWKFRALRDPQPNAFALPNGSIYVSTGLLALMDNESQLAAVLAHEMTHVMRRHQYVQNRSNRKKYLTMNVMAAVGAYAPGGIAGAVISIATAVAPFVVMATMYGYSRDLEREADHRAIDMMISAEYPPEEEIGVLKLLSKDIEGEQISLFYNDHPALDERIKYLSSYLGERADKITPQMVLNREKKRYFQQMEPLMQRNVELAINAARYRSAVYFAQRLVEFRPESSENVFLAAEAYRTLGPRSSELSTAPLSNGAKKDLAKKRDKQTLEEEERELMATPVGQENWKTHQQKAEIYYLNALSLADPVPTAHRGLGMLYEKLGRNTEALAQYEKYLEAARTAYDRERIQKRIETLRRT
ncbi:MAG: M48 family metalloprotease [Acidobacteriota bacterium]